MRNNLLSNEKKNPHTYTIRSKWLCGEEPHQPQVTRDLRIDPLIDKDKGLSGQARYPWPLC